MPFILTLLTAVMLAGTAPPVQMQASPTDCEIFASVLKVFFLHAKEAGPSSGFRTLHYVVSDRTHALPQNVEQMVTNPFWGSPEHMRSVLRQRVYADLADRSRGRADCSSCKLPSAFTIAPDRFLPATTLFENDSFDRRFAPAEGVIYFTLPGYTDDYAGALVISEMYFSLWQTSTLYYLRRSSQGGWRVVWTRILHEQGE